MDRAHPIYIPDPGRYNTAAAQNGAFPDEKHIFESAGNRYVKRLCAPYAAWKTGGGFLKGMDRLQEILDKTRRLVFFGGAGVSTGSGIPDFRSAGGLFSMEDQEVFGDLTPEMILSSSFFYLHPARFFRFYRKYMLYPTAQPNAAHRKLFEMEKADILRGIVTQNIDGLHKKAGNIRVYELHGSVHENSCMDCGERYGLSWMLEELSGSDIPRCRCCGGVVKPNVVLYGEGMDKYVCMGACREIGNADTLMVAGTSLMVEPAASFLKYFRGKNLVVINRDETSADSRASLVMREDICEVMDNLKVPVR